MKTELRSRLSLGSVLRHTAQSQPITGMPTEVPVPRNVSCMDMGFKESVPVVLAKI